VNLLGEDIVVANVVHKVGPRRPGVPIDEQSSWRLFKMTAVQTRHERILEVCPTDGMKRCQNFVRGSGPLSMKKGVSFCV
jgi:hypothetical protein